MEKNGLKAVCFLHIYHKQQGTHSTFKKYSDPFTFSHSIMLQPYAKIF